jgi:hypothetical protein
MWGIRIPRDLVIQQLEARKFATIVLFPSVQWDGLRVLSAVEHTEFTTLEFTPRLTASQCKTG